MPSPRWKMVGRTHRRTMYRRTQYELAQITTSSITIYVYNFAALFKLIGLATTAEHFQSQSGTTNIIKNIVTLPTMPHATTAMITSFFRRLLSPLPIQDIVTYYTLKDIFHLAEFYIIDSLLTAAITYYSDSRHPIRSARAIRWVNLNTHSLSGTTTDTFFTAIATNFHLTSKQTSNLRNWSLSSLPELDTERIKKYLVKRWYDAKTAHVKRNILWNQIKLNPTYYAP